MYKYYTVKTPVIIPAFNEEFRLGHTLEALPSDLVEPIVAVNGTTDHTVQIAESFGAQVLEIAQQGKMLAIQHALGSLGARALEPILLLDADARPIFPQKWHAHMLRTVAFPEVPTVVGGPVWYTGAVLGEALLRSVYRAGRTVARPKDGNAEAAIQFGPNMAISIKNKKVLDRVMSIPNYWPGEDKALATAVSEQGGVYRDIIHLYTMTWNPTSVSAISLKDRLRLGREETLKVVEQRYIDRGPQGSDPYERTIA